MNKRLKKKKGLLQERPKNKIPSVELAPSVPEAVKPVKARGLTTKEILTITPEAFSKANKQEMQRMVQKLASTANKRIKNLEKAGIETKALKYLDESGGYFSTKGKTLNQLRAEFKRARDFLNKDTSSVRGYKKMLKDTAASLKAEGVNVEASQLDKVFRAYENLRKIKPEIAEKGMKYRMLNELSAIEKDLDVNEMSAKLLNEIDRIYEDEQGRIHVFSDSIAFEE